MITLKIIDYEEHRKKILIEQSIENEIDLIYNVKNHFPELKLRISLEELTAVNNIVYKVLNKNHQSNLLFEYMDRIIANSLFHSMNIDQFNIENLLDSFTLYTESDVLNDSQLREMNQQIKKEMMKIKKKTKLIEIRCNHGQTKF